MLSSDAAWVELYGAPPPSQTRRELRDSTRQSDPPSPHYLSDATTDRWQRGDVRSGTIHRQGIDEQARALSMPPSQSDYNTHRYTEQRRPYPWDSAAGVPQHARLAGQPPTLFPASFPGSYTVTSQPVRVFPPLPLRPNTVAPEPWTADVSHHPSSAVPPPFPSYRERADTELFQARQPAEAGAAVNCEPFMPPSQSPHDAPHHAPNRSATSWTASTYGGPAGALGGVLCPADGSLNLGGQRCYPPPGHARDTRWQQAGAAAAPWDPSGSKEVPFLRDGEHAAAPTGFGNEAGAAQHTSHHHHHCHHAVPLSTEHASPFGSISDGAHHLNSLRHRSAASASALFLLSTPLSSSSNAGRGSGAAAAAAGAAAHSSRRGDNDTDVDTPRDLSDKTPFYQRHPSPRLYGPLHDSRDASALSSASTNHAATTAVNAPPPAQDEPCTVAALIFNNAKEVGVAFCELPSLTIALLQYADTAIFFKTTSLLHTRNPVEVLVPATAVESECVQTLLQQHGSHMTFTSVQRCFFNTEEGVQRLSQLKSTEEASLCIEDTDRYLCVAAANALVLYMEHVNDMQLLPGSVRVRAETLGSFMELSRTTARALQIISDGDGRVVGVLAGVAAQQQDDTGAAGASPSSPSALRGGGSDRGCTQDRRARGRQRTRSRAGVDTAPAARAGFFSCLSETHATPLQATALVDAIPRACTVMGQRCLRRTLLQPLRSRVAIQGRHDCVEWLLRDPRRLHMLRSLLRHTAALDLERLTALLTHQPRRARSETQQQSFLESLLLLWSALPYLERLHAQLRQCLGPPPPGDATEAGGSVSSAVRNTHDAQRDDDADADALQQDQQQRGTPNSSPAYPAVLHSIATALRQCRFESLAALMGQYLERSVLPAVVEQHERHTSHYGRTETTRTGTAAASGVKAGLLPGPSSASFSEVEGLAKGWSAATKGNDSGPTSRRAAHKTGQQRATSSLLRVLRMCFLVQAPRGGELDALRTRLSHRIADITAYAEALRERYHVHSLRLEPDAVKLYCLSYLASEEAKARAIPCAWRFAGGTHFAVYLAALRQQQQREQQLLHSRSPSTPGSNPQAVLWFRGSDSREDSGGSRWQSSYSATPLSSGPSESARQSVWSGPRSRDDAVSQPCSGVRTAAAAATANSALPPLTPSYDTTEQLTSADGVASAAPARPAARRRRIRCSTEDLEYRCTNAQACVAAILVQQMRGVAPLVQAIRKEFLGALQTTVESVALLDVLLSFALYSLTHRCTRPVLVDSNTGLTTAPELQTERQRSTDEGAELASLDGSSSAAAVSSPASADDEATALPGRLFHTSSTDSMPFRAASPTFLSTALAEKQEEVVGKGVPDNDAEQQRLTRASSLWLFVKGAYHPSCGVPAGPAAAPGVQYAGATNPALLSDFQHQPFWLPSPLSAEERVCGGTGDGINLSWGSTGRVCVITGPNACGKTTLLRILGQHLTLAQAGCFSPARHTQLFLSDRLFAHMLCDELPSITLSSFKRELMELNELTHAATAESLVLADELGRSTTTAQGFSLAWATALFLSNRQVHAVLTSHFAGLPSLTRVQPQRILAYHFRVTYAQVELSGTRQGRRRTEQQQQTGGGVHGGGGPVPVTSAAAARVTLVRFGHELFPGPCPQRWYGLALAERMHFFRPVLRLAQRTRACQLQDDDAPDEMDAEAEA